MADVVLRAELAGRAGRAGRRWRARAPGTGTWGSGWTGRPGRSSTGAATTGPRTGPASSSRPGWPTMTWCSPWTANLADLRRMAPAPTAAGRTAAAVARSTRAWPETTPSTARSPIPTAARRRTTRLAFDLIQAAVQGLAGQLAELLAPRRRRPGHPGGGARRLARPARGWRRAAGPAHRHRRAEAVGRRAAPVGALPGDAGRRPGRCSPRRPRAPGRVFGAEARGLGWLAGARAVRCPRCSAGTRPAGHFLGAARAPVRRGRAVRARPGRAARGRGRPVRRALAGVHRQPAAGDRRARAGRDGTAVAAAAPGRAGTPAGGCCPTCAAAADAGALAPADTAAGGGGGRPDQRAGRPARAAQPHPRRLLVGQRAVVRRPGWLIDPAAHGGHRETDLAMLALFGAPFLDRILAAYDEVAPLAAGLAGTGAAAPAAPAAGPRLPVRRRLRQPVPAPPAPPWRPNAPSGRGSAGCAGRSGARPSPAVLAPAPRGVTLASGGQRQRDPERGAPAGGGIHATVPPWAATRAATIARPSPVPPAFLLRAWSAR